MQAQVSDTKKCRKRIRKGSGQEPEEKNESSFDSVKIYFSEIKKFKLLKPEEEKNLAKRIAKGDENARKAMIEANLRLVVNIAKRYQNRGLPFQDLISEGNISLMKAVERFRAVKGCKFSTYATYWIRQGIDRALANQSNTVRLPIHVVTDINKYNKTKKKLHLQGTATDQSVLEMTGFTPKYLERIKKVRNQRIVLSLDGSSPDGNEDDMSLFERIEDPDSSKAHDLIVSKERRALTRKLLDMLPDDTGRKIMEMHFGFNEAHGPATLDQIGKTFGVTRERIRQKEARALETLKTLAKKREFRELRKMIA